MHTLITKDTYRLYANTNESLLTGPVRGICLEFPGLDGGSCLGGRLDVEEYDHDRGPTLARQGILLAYVQTGPWSWMNRGSVRLADAVLDVLFDKYGVLPVIVSGGSMGGLGALIYAADTRHRLAGCMAACPCVDVRADYAVKPDFPRTYLRAVACYDMPMEQALETISPVSRLADLPDIPYHIICDCDDALFPQAELDDFAARLAQRRTVNYVRLPGCGHGELTPEARDDIDRFVVQCVENAR